MKTIGAGRLSPQIYSNLMDLGAKERPSSTVRRCGVAPTDKRQGLVCAGMEPSEQIVL